MSQAPDMAARVNVRRIEQLEAAAQQQAQDLERARAENASLRRGLNEAIMLLDTYNVRIPQSTLQAMIVHGGREPAGVAFLKELARARSWAVTWKRTAKAYRAGAQMLAQELREAVDELRRMRP
jgi:hypothetical protein